MKLNRTGDGRELTDRSYRHDMRKRYCSGPLRIIGARNCSFFSLLSSTVGIHSSYYLKEQAFLADS